MRIDGFKLFHEVAMAKSISKVAESIHISQSALSKQVQKLEEELGHQLLIRSNKGVELTEKGEIVLKYADNITRTYESMIDHLNEENEKNHTIRIEACWPIATYALPCVLFRIKNKFPNHNYEVLSNSAPSIEDNILNNICDLGVIYGQPNHKSLSYYEIGKDKLVLVSSYDYDIPNEIQFESLFDYPFVLLNDRLNIRQIIINKTKEMNYESKKLNILYKSDSTGSVKLSVSRGYGVALVPYISIKRELYTKQLKIINITDFNMEYHMYLINEKDSEINKSVYEFTQYFKEIGKESLC